MNSISKITLQQGNELSPEAKEILKNWAIKQGYELDLVPGPTGTFDPVCDYAALLTKKQITRFLKDKKQTVSEEKDLKTLWQQVTAYFKD